MASASVASVGLLYGGVLAARFPSSKASSLTHLTSKKITLTMWVLPVTVEKETAEADAQAFHKLHPNVTIKVEESAAVGNTASDVAAAAGHTLPDIMWSADVLTDFEAQHGILMNLSPYMKAYGYKLSMFREGMMKLGQYDGNQYVIPRGFDQVMVVYNPVLFKKFHVPLPTEGWTWSTFVKDSKLLTRKVGNTQYYALGSNSTDSWYAIYDPFMRSFGGHILAPNGKTTTIDSPAVVKGGTELMNYGREYTSWFANLPKDPFLTGQAAMEWAVRPQLDGWLTDNNHKWALPGDPHLNFVNFPLLEPHPEIGAGMSGYAVSTDTKHPHTAAAFEMFLLSNAGELVRSRVAGSVPIRNDLAKSTVWRAFPPVGYKLNENAFVNFSKYDSVPPNLSVGATGPVETDIQNALEEIQLKKMTPAQAFKQAAQQINAILASNPQ
jgi:multiple sugar transport system substrate-binding protein